MGKRNLSTLAHLHADVARLVDDFERETDRGVALLGAAFLDDVLDVLLRASFVDDPDAVNKLCGTGRPLESFGARTHLAYCAGLLGRDVYHDINLIREIRNDFAHRHPASFEFPEIRLKCHRLKTVQFMLADPACSARERYTATTVMLSNHLMVLAEKQAHAPIGKDFAENGVLRLR
jgi:hypothetical protein